MKKAFLILTTAMAAFSCSQNAVPVSGPAPDTAGKWIGAPWHPEVFDTAAVRQAAEFRKTFELASKAKSAVVSVTGLGFFELYVNGSRVGDDVLSPNETSYSRRDNLSGRGIELCDSAWRSFRVPYLSYDVTALLRKGGNELLSVVGNGFYSAGSTRWTAPYGNPCFICRLDLEFADGSTRTIASGSDWQVRRSPIVQNDMYFGEIYDSRLEDSGEWTAAAVIIGPSGELFLQDGPADKVCEVLSPRSVTKLEDGRWEVDFGDYVSGWVRLNDFTLGEGETISIDFPIETAGNGAYIYIGDGRHVESYAPRFTWWVFEKAIVSGWPGELKASNIMAEVVHSDVPVNSLFECSNEMLNRLNDVWRRTETDNMHLGVATDCPHREKGPYTGDGEASCVAVLHNFDACQFYAKWMRDMSGCQDTRTGYVPNGAPWHPGCGGGVPWGAAMCIIPWEHYVRYGDAGILAENYVPMKEEVRWLCGWRLEDGTVFQEMTKPDGTPNYWLNLGEWCPPYSLPSENFVHSWYLWRCATYTAKAAKALGHDDEAAYYQTLADSTADAIHRKFYNPATGSYCAGAGEKSGKGYGTGTGNGSGDGSNIFALAMGVPDSCRAKVLDAVRSELKANDGHLNTGIYGTGLFFEVLCDNGMAEDAYVAMTKKDFPGFGYMLENGARTMWEQWNGEASRNHPMFGGGLVWLYRRVCGVQADEAAPGYRHTILRPVPCGDLTYARYSTETPYGRLVSDWKKSDGKFVYKVTVPKGCSATVYLPDGSAARELGEGRHKLSCGI